MKKIGFDAQATVGRGSGLHFFTKGLLSELINVFDLHKDYSLHILKNDQLATLNTINRMKWSNIELYKRSREMDLLHVPAFAPPIRKKKKLVVTVHDLIGLTFPNQVGIASRFYWGRWLKTCIKQADHIISDSESTKRDIVDLLKYDERKITIIHPSGHEAFSDKRNDHLMQNLALKYNIRKNFFIFVGTIEPRKNLERTLEAFSLLLLKDRFIERPQIVVVGAKNFGKGSYFKTIVNKLDLETTDILFTDFVSHEELNCLYSNSQALVFPSLYEGFGMPILEAMSSGTAVITSNVTSTPEVAGDAALLINPYKPEEIMIAMKTILNNNSVREDLIQKGKERKREFSWKICAEKTFNVYKEVLS